MLKSDYVIEISNLRKSYDESVIKGVDLKIKKGEVYALLGENGAGKSTLIRLIMGLQKRDSGELIVLGKDPAKNEKSAHEKIGYLPENFRCYDWMTVAQLINFVKPVYKRWDDEYSSDLIRRLRLPVNKTIKSFSRGTNRKVGLFLALAIQPQLLLLDEPTSGLDPLTRREFLEEMIRALSEKKVTIILSTHRADDVERFADRVGILQEGKIVIDESVSNLLNVAKRVMIRFPGSVPEKFTLTNSMMTSRFDNKIKTLIYPFDEEKFNKDISESVFEHAELSIHYSAVSIDDFFVDITKAYLQGKVIN